MLVDAKSKVIKNPLNFKSSRDFLLPNRLWCHQDSVEVAMKLSIRNSRNFAYSHEGTRASMGKDTSMRMNFFSRLSCMKMHEADGCAAPMSAEERHNLYTSMADEAFDEEEGK